MLDAILPATFERVDDRGRFVEIIAEGTWRAVIHGQMKTGSVMGNHYHAETLVYFYITKGRADIDLVAVETGDRHRVPLREGKGILLETNTSHAIRFRADTEFILLKSRAYDPDDPDTYDHPVDEIL